MNTKGFNKGTLVAVINLLFLPLFGLVIYLFMLLGFQPSDAPLGFEGSKELLIFLLGLALLAVPIYCLSVIKKNREYFPHYPSPKGITITFLVVAICYMLLAVAIAASRLIPLFLLSVVWALSR